MWWDREVRFGTGSVMVLFWWVAAFGLMAVAIVLHMWEVGMAALLCSAMGAALLVIRDNAETRRVVRAACREVAATRSVHSVRD